MTVIQLWPVIFRRIKKILEFKIYMIGTSDQKKVNLNFENIEHKKIGVHRLDAMPAIHKGIALQALLLLN